MYGRPHFPGRVPEPAEVGGDQGDHHDWSSTEQVEKYRKIGRRRAGKKTDDRRSKAITELQQLRPEADPAE
ncbi:hypothetical protein ACFWI0_27195 [[Kitasatospora] papulosa]|uniref:hypothetical protein n=1 Tax=[Kitasatospora] papulosa TaxID=1464011 RepID=UPI003627A619